MVYNFKFFRVKKNHAAASFLQKTFWISSFDPSSQSIGFVFVIFANSFARFQLGRFVVLTIWLI